MRPNLTTAITTLLLAVVAVSGTAAATAAASKDPTATAAAARHNPLTAAGCARAATTTPPVSTLPCPSDTVMLKPLDDLSKVAAAPNKTYLLPGDTLLQQYLITSSIVLDTPGTTTCYRGLEGAFIAVDVADASHGKRGFVVQNGARLGLQNLVLDGSSNPITGDPPSTGVLVEQASNHGGVVLEVNGVIFQKFTNAGQRSPVGAAVVLNNVDATFRETQFNNNQCDQEGGALSISNSNVNFTRVAMLFNSASHGGAIDMQDSRVAIEGDTNVLKYNSAVGTPPGENGLGGAVRMRGGSLTINGRLCADMNNAGYPYFGGFADIATGELVFGDKSQVNLGRNTPFTIVSRTSEALVKCGSAAAKPWTTNVSYSIWPGGPACACNAAFVKGTTSTCDGCNGAGWDYQLCACKQTTLY